MDLPHVDPIGILRWPEGFAPSRRPRPLALRVAAAVLLLVFAVATVSTTVFSLGRTCLTTSSAPAHR